MCFINYSYSIKYFNLINFIMTVATEIRRGWNILNNSFYNNTIEVILFVTSTVWLHSTALKVVARIRPQIV